MKRRKHKSHTAYFKPINLTFNLTNVDDIVKFSHELIDLSFKGKLDPRRHGAINGTVNNVIRIHQPPQGTEVNVTQQVLVAPSDLKDYSEEEQEILVRAVKIIESKAATSTK